VTTRRTNTTSTDPVIDARDDDVALLLDGSSTVDRQVQYREWVARMQAKREAARRRIRGQNAEEPAPSYWRTEDLYRDSERVAGEEMRHRPDPTAVAEMLAVLRLPGGASARDIERAYRALAKEHHPDYHVDDDEATRAYHAEQMRRVNEAYARLRQLESA
jgi:hypothetical protein